MQLKGKDRHKTEPIVGVMQLARPEKKITKEELVWLQQIVIDNPRFTKMGWRGQEGFMGEHDRRHGTPIPDHISSKWKNIHSLIDGLIATDQKLEKDDSYDAVLAAAMIAFGFVFIHPFVDGNGRIHRYLNSSCIIKKRVCIQRNYFPCFRNYSGTS